MSKMEESVQAKVVLRPRGEYRFEWRWDDYGKEYIWYIKRSRKLSSSQVEALRDPTGLESVHGMGWKANIDVVRPRDGTLCCTTEYSYTLMVKRMDELYKILKDNE